MTMFESGYYPAGAEHDPNAPWNQSEPEPVSQDIEYSCTMRRTATVETTDYVPGSVEKEWDGEGYVAVRDDDDFSDTDWLGEYKEHYRTPQQLVNLLAEIASDFINGRIPEKRISEWKDIADDCKGWEIDEENAEEV